MLEDFLLLCLFIAVMAFIFTVALLIAEGIEWYRGVIRRRRIAKLMRLVRK